MRAKSVNITTKPVKLSNRLAKRALLMSLVLASSSLANTQSVAFAQQVGSRAQATQSPAQGLIQNSEFAKSYGNRVVTRKQHSGSNAAGNVKANPFFTATDRRNPSAPVQLASGDHSNGRRIDLDMSLDVQPNDAAKGKTQFNPLFNGQPNASVSEANAEQAGSNVFANQAAPGKQTQQSVSPKANAFDTQKRSRLTATSETETPDLLPVQSTQRNDSVVDHQVVPVADSRSETAKIEETQPIFFSLSDDSVEADATDDTSNNKSDEDKKVPTQASASNAAETQSDDQADSVKPAAKGLMIEEAPLIDFSKIELATEPVEEQPAAKVEPSDSNPELELEVDLESLDELVADEAFDEDETTQDETGAASNDGPSADLAEVDSPVMLAPVLNLAQKVPTPDQAKSQPKNIKVNPNVPKADMPLDTNGPGAIQVNTAKNSLPLISQEPDDGRIPVAVAMPPIEIEMTLEQQDGKQPLHLGVVEPPAVAKATEAVASAPPNNPEDASIRSSIEELPMLPPPRAEEPPIVVAAPMPEVKAVRQSRPVPKQVAVAGPTGNTAPKPVFAERPPSITDLIDSQQAPLIELPVDNDPTKPAPVPANLASAKRSATAAASVLPTPTPTLAPPRSNHGTSIAHNSATQNNNAASKPEGQQLDIPAPAETAKNVIVLNLKKAQVRSMTIGGTLRGVTIGDKTVCQAFAASANQFKLIGTGLGSTELTVWADVKPGQPTRKQVFRIDVSDSVDATGDKATENTKLLTDSISQAFPRSEVVVYQRGGQLYVEGSCESENTATQIIRMVRKSCLIPVQDQLMVR